MGSAHAWWPGVLSWQVEPGINWTEMDSEGVSLAGTVTD